MAAILAKNVCLKPCEMGARLGWNVCKACSTACESVCDACGKVCEAPFSATLWLVGLANFLPLLVVGGLLANDGLKGDAGCNHPLSHYLVAVMCFFGVNCLFAYHLCVIASANVTFFCVVFLLCSFSFMLLFFCVAFLLCSFSCVFLFFRVAFLACYFLLSFFVLLFLLLSFGCSLGSKCEGDDVLLWCCSFWRATKHSLYIFCLQLRSFTGSGACAAATLPRWTTVRRLALRAAAAVSYCNAYVTPSRVASERAYTNLTIIVQCNKLQVATATTTRPRMRMDAGAATRACMRLRRRAPRRIKSSRSSSATARNSFFVGSGNAMSRHFGFFFVCCFIV
jgi:hypothetical protein